MGPELQAEWAEHAAEFTLRGQFPPDSVLEIGSGMGDSLVALAAARPDVSVVGIEVHRRGLAATVRAARAAGLENLRVVEADAMTILADRVPSASVREIHIWFPDPWPKARHHKRRLIRPAVGELLADRLQPGGALRLATDWSPYAEVMVAVLGATPGLTGGMVPRPDWRPITGYERQGLAAGRIVRDLAYVRG